MEFPSQGLGGLGGLRGSSQQEMTRGLGGPRVKARLAREGSRRGVLRAGRKENAVEGGWFRGKSEKNRGPG